MLIVVALSVLALSGFLALSVDIGLIFRAKRNLQIAADAAATAAALDLYYNASVPSATSAAQSAAEANGFSAVNDPSSFTVNLPPLNGPSKGNAAFVEVILKESNPTLFMKLFQIDGLSVAARAVAGTPNPSRTCVYVLNPSDSAAMELQGSFDVSASHCGVVVNSSSPSALQFVGSSGSLEASSVSVVGGDSGQSSDSTPKPVTGTAPVNDPLDVSGPVPPSGCAQTSTATSITGNFSGPGTGSAICFSNAVNIGSATLGSGIYVFEQGVTLSGAVTSGSGGTTLDVYSGSFTAQTGTVLNLVAPTSGATNGIALMQPSSNSNQIQLQIGNVTGSLTGIIYAPAAQLYLNDSGGDNSGGITLTTDLVVNSLYDKTATLSIQSYSAANRSTTPLKSVALVE